MRLNSIFFYYFEESIVEKFSDRVVILSGDVTDKDSFEKFKQYHIDTVINCAANVKHFSKGTDIEDVNLYGTLKVIVKSVFLCLSSFNDRFIFESTKVNEFELILKLGFVKDFFLINIESV